MPATLSYPGVYIEEIPIGVRTITGVATSTTALPNSLDVAAIGNAESIDAARTTLLARCLLSAERGGERIAADQLPSEIASEVAARMSVADPQADVRLACTCPECGHSWQATFDVASFFWTEICA